MPALKIWYDKHKNLVWYDPQDMVCYQSKFGKPPFIIWYATPQNLVCHTSKFDMPLIKIWYDKRKKKIV